MRSALTTIRHPRALAVLALAMLALGFAGLTPSVAQALCYEPSCNFGDDPVPKSPPPPAPVTTTLTGVSPAFGWAGDTVTLTGTGFTGATVTFNGLPATIVSSASTQLVVTVPAIPNVGGGPVTVLVSSPKGTASNTFTLSPTLQVGGGATFGVNAQFGQGTDGWANGQASVDRFSGFALSQLTVHDDQGLWSLSVDMSVALLDGSGTVIGFTHPQTVTSRGFVFAFPSGNTTAVGNFSEALDPTMTARARSATVILTRDANAELLDTLNNAVATGQTIYSVLSTLAPFFA
jgi:IPT/TIG domain